MRRRRFAVAAAVAALAAGGAGAAIAATSAKDDPKQVEDAILGAAAKKLGVTTDQLRDALAQAQDAQLDQAVKDGRLTREQADAIKKRRAERGTVLGFPGGPGHHHRHGPGGPGRGVLLPDVARALGITPGELMTRLRDGKTLAQIAKAEGKSLDDVKSSVKAAARKRLDEAVKEGDITRAEADERLEHLSEHIDRLGEGRRGFKRGPGRPGFGPPPGDPGRPSFDEDGPVGTLAS